MKRSCVVLFIALLATPAAALQSAPRIATDGTNSILTWVEQNSDSAVQMIMPLDASGGPRDTPTALGATVRVRPDNFGWNESAAASIAFGDSVYLAVWREPSRIVGRRLDRDGRALDAQPIVFSETVARDTPGVSDQAIAWDGVHFLVVWQSDEGVFTTLVSEDGTVSLRRKLLGAYYDLNTKVMWSGRNYIVTWHRYTFASHWFVPDGILFARVGTDGLALDALSDVRKLPTITHNSYFGWPFPIWHLASSGRETMVVVDKPGVDGYQRVSAFVVHDDEQRLLLGSAKTLFLWFDRTASDVTWDGVSYAAAWRFIAERATPVSTSSWMMTARFDSEGRVYDRAIAEGGRPGVLTSPAIGATPTGSRIIVQAEVENGAERRLRLRTDRDLRVPPPAPRRPTVISVSATTNGNIVQWEYTGSEATGFVVEGITKYGVMGNVVTDAWKRLAFVSGTAARVRAFNEGGLSDPSNTESITLPARRRTVPP